MNRNNLFFIIILGISLLAGVNSCNSYVSQGEALYDFYCSNCHMDDGSGLEGLIPPLTDAAFLNENREQLPCILKYGIEEPLMVNGVTYTDPMEGIRELTPTDITNILNYIAASWGNDLKTFLPEEVDEAVENCEPTYNK